MPWATLGTAFDYRARYYFSITPSRQLVAWKGALEVSSAELGWEDTDQSEPWDAQGPGLYQESPDSAVVVLRRFGGRIQRYTGPDQRRVLLSQPQHRDGQVLPSGLVMSFFANLDEMLARMGPSLGPEGRLLDLGRQDEELLARYCVVLALFEEMTRPGAAQARVSSPLLHCGALTVDDLLRIAEDHWVDDLCSLSQAFFHAFQGRFSDRAVLNPIFRGSGDVGGADADIIVGNCLVDFKATVKAAIGKLELYQLIGYALLDYDDEYGIERVGFYMARQGEFIEWPIADLFKRLMGRKPPPLPDLRQEFKDRITTP